MELHGRQFVAGPNTVERRNLPGRESFGPLKIGFHASLPVTRLSVDALGAEYVALGHIIDPTRPERGNRDVLNDIAACSSFDQLEGALAGLGGRWLLLARLRDHMRLYPDAAGSKSVFYSDGWLASQPGLLGYPIHSGLSAYPNAVTWPVGETPFEGVRQLLPNHFLDLNTFHAVRFGPNSIVRVDIQNALRMISATLEGIIKAIVMRGSAALPLTGGYDSRTLLSAGRAVRDRLDLFTVVDDRTERHDWVIPRALAKRLGRPIRFVRSDHVEDVSANTCGLWRDRNQDRLSAFAQAEIVVLGHLSEILRCFYWKDGVSQIVTPELLSKIAGFDGARQEAFSRWLKGVPPDCGIDLLDLFYWESRAGNWSSLCCTALDSYCDVISPYNCRRLIETGLGVDVAYRREPHEMHRLLCHSDLRAIPFNVTWLERMEKSLPAWAPWRARMLMRRLGRTRLTRG